MFGSSQRLAATGNIKITQYKYYTKDKCTKILNITIYTCRKTGKERKKEKVSISFNHWIFKKNDFPSNCSNPNMY